MSGWVSGMRDAFFDALYQIAKEDDQVVLVTSDTGAFCHDEWRASFPERYVNVGIAEQNLIGVAAGLAMSGKKPYAFAIIPFVTMRCYEQVRVDLCCMNLPVTLVGIGGGYDYSTLGPTHHGTEDVALMRGLPEMQVFVPSDRVAASAFVGLTYDTPGPKYVRLCRKGEPLIYPETAKAEDFTEGLSVVRDGSDVALIANGRQVGVAREVAERLAKESVSVKVIDLYRAKPLNVGALAKEIAGAGCVATLEEHFVTGGIGTAVAELLVETRSGVKFLKLGIQDSFCRRYGDWDYLQALAKIDAASVTETILRWVRE